MVKVLLIFLLSAGSIASRISLAEGAALNPNPPAAASLIFIHHSTGENWLSDTDGGLGIALAANNYYVSDTNYGWGPNAIGDTTDIGNWWSWFRGPASPAILSALYNESGQNAAYSRLSAKPAGENQIIMLKSCFPNSALRGNAADIVPLINSNPLAGQDSSSEYHTIANVKGIYIDLLNYFATRQDKLFIVITAPPLSDGTWANNARAFNQWMVKEWLKNYPYKNVGVFDFYNVLTTNGGNSNINDLSLSTGNHHRWTGAAIAHMTDGDNDHDPNTNEYPSGDDHPSMVGNLKATAEFLPLLNIYYNCWKGMGGCPNDGQATRIRPDIKANGSDGPLTVNSDTPVQLSIDLAPGEGDGTNADWWGYAETPFGWYYFSLPNSWSPISSLTNMPAAYQHALFNIPTVSLSDQAGLPAGRYTVYFGIDTNMNGQAETTQPYFDSVQVHITQ